MVVTSRIKTAERSEEYRNPTHRDHVKRYRQLKRAVPRALDEEDFNKAARLSNILVDVAWSAALSSKIGIKWYIDTDDLRTRTFMSPLARHRFNAAQRLEIHAKSLLRA